ncbi:restriction endonuclease subunit S [Pseudomonas aeruginosa]
MSFDLPKLPDGWEYQPLDQLSKPSSVTYGVVQPGAALSTGAPIIRVNNFRDGRIELADLMRIDPAIEGKYGRTRLKGGEVLLTLVGSVGQVAVAPKTVSGFNVARAVAVIHPEDRVEPEWIALCLRSPLSQHLLGSRANTTVQTTINLKDLRALPIPLPPASERREIASAMLALDDRITLLRETNATLEAIAQALFKSWFVDFDPVRAKAEGRARQDGERSGQPRMPQASDLPRPGAEAGAEAQGQPEGAIQGSMSAAEGRMPKAAMDAATAALFPDSFEESELGLVPKGWVVRSIGELVEGIYDGPHATPAESADGPVFLGIKNLTGTSLDLSDIRHISESDWTQWTRRVEPRHGDIVFSYEATLGFFALIPPGVRCCLGRRLALVRPHAENGAGLFWFHQFISAPFQQLLDKHTIHGATVNRIALKAFPSYLVLNPPEPLKSVFVDSVAPLWAAIHENQAQAQTLTQLRDTLLPRLISGQLRLPEAETLLEKAL